MHFFHLYLCSACGMVQKIKITKTGNEDRLYLTLGGRLDANAALVLETMLKNSIKNVKELTIDMRTLEYLSSEILCVLLDIQKNIGRQINIKVVNVNDGIMGILKVTGFFDILTVEKEYA